jgi:hypothetical protein
MKALKWLKKLFTGQLVLINKDELFFLKQLESENKILHKDIYNLVCKAKEDIGMKTNMRWQMRYALPDAMHKATIEAKKRLAVFCKTFDKDSNG